MGTAPLKVALINNFPPYSGTGRVAYELFERFRRPEFSESVAADLFCTHVMRREEFAWAVNENVKFLHRFAYKENETLSRLLIYFVDPYRVPRNYDVYHITNHMLARFALTRRPAVVTVHDVLQFKYRERMSHPLTSLVYNFLMDRSLRALKKADHLIAVSVWSAAEAAKALAVPSEKISVVSNGLNHQLFFPRDKAESRRRLGLPPEGKIILHVGSEIPRKNLGTLFRALRLVVDQVPSTRLLRVGEKTGRSQRLLQELRLDEGVIYREYLKEEEMPFAYSGADVLVLPSFEEGFGFPVIEAQACGLPVIVAARSSLPEVGGEPCFYLDDPEDVGQLREKIIRVLGSQEFDLSSLIKRGLMNANRFSWEKTAQETLAVYQAVIEKGGKR